MRAGATLGPHRAIEKHLRGPTYIVWRSSARLNGIVLWGHLEEEHARRIASAFEGDLAPGLVPHASLIDARRLRAVELGAFSTLSRQVPSSQQSFARLVTRQALVRPEGLAGAAVASFYSVFTPSYPTGVFTDPTAALKWLGVEEEIGIVAELDALFAEVAGGSAVVTALRAYLELTPGVATLRDSAKALGLSPRNLQRKLREANTSFQLEQNAAQVRLAKALMLDTNYDLKRIAIEVGCASAQNFSVLFRRNVGATPSEWRAHLRTEVHSRHT